MRFLLLLPLLGCVSSASVLRLTDTSYVVVVDGVEVWDCRTDAGAPGTHDPVCYRADLAPTSPDAMRRRAAERAAR